MPMPVFPGVQSDAVRHFERMGFKESSISAFAAYPPVVMSVFRALTCTYPSFVSKMAPVTAPASSVVSLTRSNPYVTS